MTILPTFYEIINVDELVKSLKMHFSVIPAEAGIQYFQMLINTLDSGFHLSARYRQAGVTTFTRSLTLVVQRKNELKISTSKIFLFVFSCLYLSSVISVLSVAKRI